MKNFKKIIIGASLAFAITIALPAVTKAYYPGWMMNNQNISDQNWDDMRIMHDLMWKDENLTQKEFEQLVESQKEFMGWSWIERAYENAEEYNKNRESGGYRYGRGRHGRGGGYNYGHGMMWGY